MVCVVRGSCNIDEIYAVPHIARPGETIASSSVEKRPGGKGANQAVAIARAGQRVEFAGCIGDDGHLVEETLDSEGVGTAWLVTSSLPTGRAVIQVAQDGSGENAIVLSPGANFDNTDVSAQVDYYGIDMVVLQNEIPLEQTVEAMRCAKRDESRTLWNPSPMPRTEELAKIPWSLLDWLVVNEGEAEDLLVALGGTKQADLLGALAALKQLKQTSIVVTLGPRGAAAVHGGRRFQVPAGQVDGPVVDTTGAGDTFTGYLVASLAKDPRVDIERALRIACQAAAMAVESNGAMDAIPNIYEVRERMGEKIDSDDEASFDVYDGSDSDE